LFGLDLRPRGDRVSGLRILPKLAIFPARVLRRLRSTDLADRQASGEGTVYATSLVCRAATEETRAHLPYNIVLVDSAEGFRMMAHGDATLAIGDKVAVRFTRFAGRLVPYFEKVR
jgi:uncharacterized protein